MGEQDDILVRHLRRSYHALDGLWFMVVEADAGFERALELDRRVWEVVAKIQARKARELLGLSGNSPEELTRCFSLKLTADGHRFSREVTGEGVSFRIEGCPWLELLRKSGRQHLAARIAEAVCSTEGGAWCKEFGAGYEFSLPRMACSGEGECEMRFERKDPSAHS